METMSSSSSLSVPQDASTYDEISMQQSLLFSDSLRDLKNLRAQLYSAAEYFELSYSNDDQKQIVVSTLKDYAVQALVNTVDHLGSVTYKVNGLLDEKVDEVSGTELRVSCIEQRLRTCQEFIDREGIAQQSLVITTPKYHKRYILPGKLLIFLFCSFSFIHRSKKAMSCNTVYMFNLQNLLSKTHLQIPDYITKDLWAFLVFWIFYPVEEPMSSSRATLSRYQSFNQDNEDYDWHQLRTAIRSKIRDTPPSSVRKSRSPSPSPRPGTFFFTDKRAASPVPGSRPLSRSGSLSSSRPTTPNSSNAGRRYPSAPRKSASMRVRPENDGQKETEQVPSKSKRLLKALLSRRKSKNDQMLYSYLDEY